DYDAGATETGRVDVFHGGPSGLTAAAAWVLAPSDSYRFGAALAGVGDVDGDGFDDLAIATESLGQVSVYLGSGGGLSPTASWSREVAQNVHAVPGSAGDVDGDGRDEILVGSPEGSLGALAEEGLVEI